MKNLRTRILALSVLTLFLTSCSQRLVDFTVISSQAISAGIDKTKGVKVEGRSMKFLGIGANIKDAIDDALDNAGAEYDILVDGVLRVQDNVFVKGYVVTGTAISSKEMTALLGEEGFKAWLQGQDVFDAEKAQKQMLDVE